LRVWIGERLGGLTERVTRLTDARLERLRGAAIGPRLKLRRGLRHGGFMALNAAESFGAVWRDGSAAGRQE